MRGVAKNTTVLLLARIVERGTTLVVTLVLAAKLGATGLGTYATAFAVFGAISVAGEAGSTLYVMRELATDRARTSSYVVHLSVLAVGVTVVLTAVLEVVVRHVGYSAPVRDSISLLLLAIPPTTLNSIQESVFVVHGRTELETITTFVSSVIYVAITYVLLTQGDGVQTILAVYVGLEFLVTIVYYAMISRFISSLRWEFRWPMARRLISEIKPFTGSSVLAALLTRPEVIILSLVSTTRQVGYYSAAVRIAEVWGFVPEVFLNNVYPLLTRAHHVATARFAAIQAKALRAILAYALPLTAGVLATAKPIIDLLFGHGFARSVTLLQLLAVNITLIAVMDLLWRSVSARGRQDTVLRIQVVVSSTWLCLAAAMITPLAALGAAISTPLRTVMLIVPLERAIRRTGAPARLIGTGWRFAVAAAAMGGVSWLLTTWLTIWLVVPIAAMTYVAATFAIRALTPDDVRTLRQLLPRAPVSAER